MGTLHIVATPIGDLRDVTMRAVEVLRGVSLILSEDTRTTRKLLDRYEITTPMLAYNEHNHAERLSRVLRTLEGGDIALVSEAGMPAISDPGEALVRAAVEAGNRVSPVPGPSALTAALAVSGMPATLVTFIGFLPRKKGERRRLLSQLADRPDTLIAFEAPHRIQDSLEDAALTLGGDRRIVVCREMTKLHEEVFRGTLREALTHFVTPRGEFTLVIAGAPTEASGEIDEAATLEELRALRDRGVGAKQAIAEMALTRGLSRRDLYRLWLQLGDLESD
ncbi:MAG: 16S rRNA (cytidine(1402)-2'-O)-methyltransferase [Dehalococcoidia bacterium]|nr:16S rRNA (cytidine(1402)-2'-O)-methyltransferase [Dehalococcoidia bacterium]